MLVFNFPVETESVDTLNVSWGSRKIKFTFLGLTISCLQLVFAHRILEIVLLLLPALLNDLGVVFKRSESVQKTGNRTTSPTNGDGLRYYPLLKHRMGGC